jgi:hypothetical protein
MTIKPEMQMMVDQLAAWGVPMGRPYKIHFKDVTTTLWPIGFRFADDGKPIIILTHIHPTKVKKFDQRDQGKDVQLALEVLQTGVPEQ